MVAFERDISSDEETFCLPWKYRQRLALHLLDRVVTDTVDSREIIDATKKLDEFQEKINLVFEKLMEEWWKGSPFNKSLDSLIEDENKFRINCLDQVVTDTADSREINDARNKLDEFQKKINFVLDQLMEEWWKRSLFNKSLVSFSEAENDFNKSLVSFSEAENDFNKSLVSFTEVENDFYLQKIIKSEEDITSFSDDVSETDAITKSDIGPLTERDYIIFTERDIDVAEIALDSSTESDDDESNNEESDNDPISESNDDPGAKSDLDPLTERDFDFLNYGYAGDITESDDDESDNDSINEGNDDPVAKSDLDPITQWDRILKIVSYSLDLVPVRKEERGARSEKMKGTGSLATFLAFDMIKHKIKRKAFDKVNREMEIKKQLVDKILSPIPVSFPISRRLINEIATAETIKAEKE